MQTSETYCVENILINQKDKILKGVNNANTPSQLEICLEQLNLVREFWAETGYTYKTKEVASRIVNAAYAMEAEYKSKRDENLRGSRRYRELSQDIGKLDGIIGTAAIIRSL